MNKAYLMPLLLLFVVACASDNRTEIQSVEYTQKFIDFLPSNHKASQSILFAKKEIYHGGNLCKYLISSNVRAVRLSQVIERSNYANNTINEFKNSKQYTEWRSELDAPRNDEYYEYASIKIERLKQSLKEEIVKNSIPAIRTYINQYMVEFDVPLILNGDLISDYDSFCPEIFSPEKHILDGLNGEF